MMPNLGDLQAGDIVPCLRPPFSEGTALISDVQKYVRPYDVYTALLTQTGTDAPVATVLENTLEFTPTWNYFESGKYGFNFPSTPNFDKIFSTIGNLPGETFGIITCTDYDILAYTGNGNDDYFYRTPIEIRVYYSEPA